MRTPWPRRRALRVFLLLTALHVTVFLAGLVPTTTVESVYARVVFPALRGAVAPPLSVIPVSLVELMAIGFVLCGAGAVVQLAGRILRRTRSLALGVAFLWIGGAAVHGYLLGHGWLLRRPELARRLSLPTVPGDAALAEAARTCARAAQSLRQPPPAHLDLAEADRLAREAVQNVLPRLGADLLPAGRIKPVFPAGALLWFGVTGFFSPFTFEPHVDPVLDPIDLVFVAAHELAHVAGFGREDEADFVAWLACQESPEPFLRYAGQLAALGRFEGHADGPLVEELRALAGAEVRADRKRAADVIRSYRSPGIATWRRRAYDRMLKTQGIASGIGSYDAMVRLILAWQARS